MPKTTRLAGLEYGSSSIVFPGQHESGDLFIVKELAEKVIIGVVDGMGHGPEAAAAAKSAIETVDSNAELSVIKLINLCHENLKSTRGVVMALASINYSEDTLAWLSIGNVEGMLLRSDPKAKPAYESIFICPGVLGYRLSQLNVSIIQISKGDLLIFSTDGIKSDYILRIAADVHDPNAHSSGLDDESNTKPEDNSGMQNNSMNRTKNRELSKLKKGIMNLTPFTVTDYIARRFSKGSDDALVLAIKYLGKS
jgi:serine phosphatase RsbU (regulator of sigma subunit)